MSREQMLLDRIAASGADRRQGRYDATTEENPEALMESIKRQLTRLLNSRHGMCEALPDYGLPALSDMLAGRDQYLRIVQDAIRSAIEKYEPRLRRARVTHRVEEGDVRTLVFRIDAVMVGRGGEYGVWYETAFSPDGEFSVSG